MMLACPENAAARVSAGGINAGNATAFAQAGADVLVAVALYGTSAGRAGSHLAGRRCLNSNQCRASC
jgi:pentose-5-phosphate-3-epimerase